MKDKKKVAIYMRCSKYTIERYREMYTKLMGYVRSQADFELVEIYYDNAPGKWQQCPQELQRLLRDAGEKHFEIVVVEKLEAFSFYSRNRTDIEGMLDQYGVRVVRLHTALKEQRAAEKARSALQYEMLEDALQRGSCLTDEQFRAECKAKTDEFIKYIDESFGAILDGEPNAPYRKVIGIHVGDKICCIPLTARSLLILRDAMDALRRSID